MPIDVEVQGAAFGPLRGRATREVVPKPQVAFERTLLLELIKEPSGYGEANARVAGHRARVPVALPLQVGGLTAQGTDPIEPRSQRFGQLVIGHLLEADRREASVCSLPSTETNHTPIERTPTASGREAPFCTVHETSLY